jgi:hypothetical protein
MVLLACPPVIQDTFPGAPTPFGPALATLAAGLPAAGQYWRTNWTCGQPLGFGKLSLSGFPPITPCSWTLTPTPHPWLSRRFSSSIWLCPPAVHGQSAAVRIGSIGECYKSHNLSPPSALLHSFVPASTSRATPLLLLTLF